jgi:uncharacterized protein YbbK (DUF523 family)
MHLVGGFITKGARVSWSEGKIQVGVSRCLLGDAVRYDGGHKRHEVVCDILGRLFDLAPVCPEIAAGLGAPRPPVRLVEGAGGVICVLGVEDENLDVTDVLIEQSRALVSRLEGVSGFVLKSRSPSCGLAGVPLFQADGNEAGFAGMGVFARALRQTFPDMPLIEETDLDDAALLEDFVQRVRDYHRRKAKDADGGGA